MGDNFLKSQIRTFEKRRDRAVCEMDRVTLFRRSEVFSTEYKAKVLEGESPKEGEIVFAVAPRNGGGIVIARGHHPVGEILGQSAEALAEAMRPLGSVVEVRVLSVSEVSRRMTVEVTRR